MQNRYQPTRLSLAEEIERKCICDGDRHGADQPRCVRLAVGLGRWQNLAQCGERSQAAGKVIGSSGFQLFDLLGKLEQHIRQATPVVTNPKPGATTFGASDRLSGGAFPQQLGGKVRPIDKSARADCRDRVGQGRETDQCGFMRGQSSDCGMIDKKYRTFLNCDIRSPQLASLDRRPEAGPPALRTAQSSTLIGPNGPSRRNSVNADVIAWWKRVVHRGRQSMDCNECWRGSPTTERPCAAIPGGGTACLKSGRSCLRSTPNGSGGNARQACIRSPRA